MGASKVAKDKIDVEKKRLIIDFDNKEELIEFFNTNGGDIEKLKFLEHLSIKDKIDTYYTEFEKGNRTKS